MGNQVSYANYTTIPIPVSNQLSEKAKQKLGTQVPPKSLATPPNSNHKKAADDTFQFVPPTEECAINQVCLFNNRRYIVSPYAKYLMPCDADETDRLIVMHYLLKHALQHNFIAPVHAVLNQGDYDPHERATVLDIGAGAGTWIMEMASEFRSADFHGIDIANMYPSTIKPTNAHFQHHDVLCGTLPFDDEAFDYVYMRQMLPGMTKEQLHNVLSEILRVLKPNGYVEIVDAEFAIQRAGPVTQSLMNTHLVSRLGSLGIDVQACRQMATVLMTTQSVHGGFVDTMQHQATIPLGWGGKFGELHAHNVQQYLEALDPALTQSMSTSDDKPWPALASGAQHPRMARHQAASKTDTVAWSPAAIKHMIKECKKYQSHRNWYVTMARKAPATPAATLASSLMSRTSPAVSIFSGSHGSASTHYAPSVFSNKSMHPPTPPIDKQEWDSINDFISGFKE